MGILNVVTDKVGQVGVVPRIVEILCNDSFATITTANYLEPAIAAGYQFLPTDTAQVTYGTDSDTTAFFDINFSGSTITLVPQGTTVVLPVADGHFANFSGTSGTLDDKGYSATNAAKEKVVMANGAVVSGNMASFSDTAGTVTDSSVVANRVLYTGFATPDANANIVRFDTTITAAQLASAAVVPLFTSSGTKQYKILNLWVNAPGTNFSGGGGDRLLNIQDGTTTYTVIPAASLQTLANTTWGATELPFPEAAALNTSTVAGEDITAMYSGGAADYAAGSVVISGLLQRVA